MECGWSCANCAAERWRVPPNWDGTITEGSRSRMGSDTRTRSTGGRVRRLVILAPNATSSFAVVMIVAPSTAVKPAMASTARRRSSCHSWVRRSSCSLFIRSASSVNFGATAYTTGSTIDSRQWSSLSGTMSSAPPRRWARMEAARCTSRLTDSPSAVTSLWPSSDLRRPGHSGPSAVLSSTILI